MVVHTPSGLVRGRRTSTGTVFHGVPYAAAPAGAGRFAAPAPHEPWAGIRDATRPGSAAPQPVRDAFGTLDLSAYFGTGRRRGPDYLTADIWAPPPSGRPAPVIVFVHGGGFVAGSAQAPLYTGESFNRDAVVLVTLNYRLGLPGFLHLPGAPDNRGLLDVLAGLRWVRDTIACFGGDPDRVTLAGQSAGAILVGGALADPAAAGLFRRAIMQSGSGTAAMTPAQAEVVTAAVARSLGGAATTESLGALSDDELVALIPRPADLDLRTPLSGITPFSLVLDRQPATVAQHPAELLIGSNLDEGALYLAPLGVLAGSTEADLHATAARFHPDPGPVVRAYRAAQPGASIAGLRVAILGDGLFGDGTRAMAAAHAAAAPTYRYRFDWRSGALGGQLGASHVLELPFVFDCLDLPAARPLLGPEPPPAALATRMHAAWVRFAATGDPGWDGHPHLELF